ncbi:MAG: SusC/RagA family TonB-linked outer membrane protein [Prevotellaceae bacterium]|jgi:TonB-linked SusC/RagA family outer membrane protein|nr:SusC/RagA family TonB-linked outer membrane protein [Prevotellaceae bacterium]
MNYFKTKVNFLVLLFLFSLPMVSLAQTTITGAVTDRNGLPLAGASVVVQGTTKVTMADIDGKFSLTGVEPGQVAFISFVGYITKAITIGNEITYDVVLDEETATLDEVVVTALGIKRAEKALSYNVQKLNNEALTTVKDASFMNALAGKVAGVNISSSSAGPGSSVKIVMRGLKSIQKDNNAMYVIDGIPMFNTSFGSGGDNHPYTDYVGSDAAADLNAEDIESITVLTGPSAAALYGSEAANGVVLITTKKGLAGRTVVTASNSTTFSSPFVMPEFQNKYGNNIGETGSWGAPQSLYSYDPTKFFNTGTTIVNAITLSTGTEKSQSYLSFAGTNAHGILPTNEYDRYNFAYRNTTSFLNDKLVLDVSANYILQKDVNMVADGLYHNPLPAVYLFPRGENFDEVRTYERYDELLETTTQYWPYGTGGLELQNPYWTQYKMTHETNKKRYMLSAGLQYNVTNWLNVVGRAKVDNANFVITDKRYAGTLPTLAGPNGFFSKNNRLETQTYADIIANINKDFTDFNVNANIGASIKDLRMDSEKQVGNLNYINLFTTENMIRPSGYKNDADGYIEQTQSIFANVEVGYKSMLYLTVTGRNDWDSALAFSKSTSFFYPSVGLSGVISEMVKLPEQISFLKLRASYSSVGTSFGRYMTQFFYTYNEQTNSYDAPKIYPSYDLKPELTNSWELGLNVRLFKGMVNMDATWYHSNTLNQTFKASLSAGSGYESVYVQSGDVRNMGIELALGFNNMWGNFGWASNVTFTWNDNRVNRLANDILSPIDGTPIEMPTTMEKARLGDTGGPLIMLSEGGTMGDLYIDRALKRDEYGNVYINEITGLPQMEIIEAKKIGTTLAKSTMGWQNTFSWNGIDLSVLVSARFGGYVVSGTQAILDRYGVSANSVKVREKGVSSNGVAIDPKGWFGVIAQGTGMGAHYVYDATNIRLQEVSLGYTIPRKWLGDVANVTVSLVGRNLLMLYSKAPFDPELSASTTETYYAGVDYFMLPSLRNIGFTIKLQF